MLLDVINSGSEGNCYVLHNANEALVLEAGMPIVKIRSLLGGVSKVSGCFVTHEHGDHAKYLEQYMENGIKCHATLGTCNAINYKGKRRPTIITIGKATRCGSFMVLPIKTVHDYPTCRAMESCSFLINHEETGTILFATDTQYLPNRYSNISNIMIECNYEKSILARNVIDGKVSPVVAERTRNTHQSLDTCIDMLEKNDISKVNNIVLIHLSKENSSPEIFKNTIEERFGKKTYIARKGLSIRFNKGF